MLVLPERLPTEHILSLLHRLGILNGLKDGLGAHKHLMKRCPPNGEWWQRSCAVILADLYAVPYDDFARQHTCVPFLNALKKPPEHGSADEHFTFRSSFAMFYTQLPSGSPRFCSECVTEDMDWHGFSFWRTHHFLPGVDRCSKHRIQLFVTNADPLTTMPHHILIGRSRYTYEALQDLGNPPMAEEYRQAALDLLDLRHPQHVVIFSDELVERARIRHYSRSMATSKGTLGHFVESDGSGDAVWARAVLESTAMRTRARGTTRGRINRSVVGTDCATASALIAGLFLFEKADLVSALFRLTQRRPSRHPERRDLDFSRTSIRRAYISSNGNYSAAEKVLGLSGKDGKTYLFQNLGLPSLGRFSEAEMSALRSVCEGISIDESCKRFGCSSNNVALAFAAICSPFVSAIESMRRQKKPSGLK